MTESPTARSFAKAEATSPPFDSARLDALLDEAGIDAAVISSKHNIQYLFGGYRFFFFDHFDAIGVSRYLPFLVYVKGRPDQSTYVGHGMEAYEKDLGKFWTQSLQTAGTTLDSAQRVVDHLLKLAPSLKRVGVERAFLPADAAELLTRELPGVTFVEAHLPLERLRARKTREELDLPIPVAASSSWRTRSRSPIPAGKPLAIGGGDGIEAAPAPRSSSPKCRSTGPVQTEARRRTSVS